MSAVQPNSPSFFAPLTEKIDSWAQKNPTTLKVTKIALFILGMGLLIAIPYVVPALGIVAGVLVACAGIASLVSSAFLSRFPSSPSFATAPAVQQQLPAESPAHAQPEAPVEPQALAQPQHLAQPPAPAQPEAPVEPQALAQPQPLAQPPAPVQLQAPAQQATPLWNKLREKTKLVEVLKPEEVVSRFTNVDCPRATAIRVGDRYMHANRVGGAFLESRLVASQAPIDLALFWQYIFEQEASIVDLTAENEVFYDPNNRTTYYPSAIGQPETFGEIRVTCLSRNLSFRVFEVEKGGVKKQIQRLRCTAWPDGGNLTLDGLNTLISLIKQMNLDPTKDLLVHCRAGNGRTGTLISALAVEEQIAKGNITLDDLDEGLTDLIAALRKDRGWSFVSWPLQLELVREYAEHLLKKKS